MQSCLNKARNSVETPGSQRCQEHGRSSEDSCSPRGSQMKREFVWAATSKIIGMGMSKVSGTYNLPPCASGARYGTKDLMLILLGFVLVLVIFFPIPLFFF